VPIHFDTPQDELTAMLGNVNGLLFPGGGADLTNTTDFAKAGRTLWQYALKANDNGDHFPIYATCMGFQQIIMIAAETDSVLCEHCFEAEGTPLPLDFTSKAPGKFFSEMSTNQRNLYNVLAHENLTENSHHDGVTPAQFDSGNANLNAFFDVISTNLDTNSKEFVSTIEAKKYPIFASKCHDFARLHTT
jgi:gamma-glutamyl hydrolase